MSGCNIKPIEKPKITDNIALLQDYELIIDADSTNLIKELNNYSWHDKKSKVPIDAYNHCFVGSTLITTDKGLVPLKEIKEGDISRGYRSADIPDEMVADIIPFVGVIRWEVKKLIKD